MILPFLMPKIIRESSSFWNTMPMPNQLMVRSLSLEKYKIISMKLHLNLSDMLKTMYNRISIYKESYKNVNGYSL
jgi:hypothetical protein